MKRPVLITIMVIVGVCLCIAVLGQALITSQHTNPPVVSELNWDSPATRALAKRACFDCHSNETVWPWYTNVPPFSLVILNDVREGRETLNFSDWKPGSEISREPDEIAEVIYEGEMPPGNYLRMHPEARLTQEEKAALAEGLTRTVSNQ